jgi:hypothetical protein
MATPDTTARQKKKEMVRMETKRTEAASGLMKMENWCITPGVAKAIPPEEVLAALVQHRRERRIVRESWESGTDSPFFEEEFKLSAHRSLSGVQFWIISELNPAFVTVTLPGEY